MRFAKADVCRTSCTHNNFDVRQVDLEKVEYFIQRVGECEDQIFQKRARLLRRQKERRERDKQNGGRGGGGRGRGR